MKRISVFIIAMMLSFSCSDDFSDINDNPKRATTAPAATLFSNAEKNLMDIMTTPNVNSNVFRLLAQQWTETTYTDESRYDLSTRNIPQNFWNALYRDVLLDLREAKRQVEAADPNFTDPTENQNQLAIAEILEVYTWYVLETTFGNIPYSQALDIDNVFPEYEDARTIHTDLIARITTAVNSLNVEGGSYGAADLIYRGDTEKWRRFGNTLKLKLGMMLADVDAATAGTVVSEAVTAGVMQSNEDNATLNYLESPPNTNPIWVNLVQSGRKDFVAANTIVDRMVALNDPRVPYFFTIDAEEGYSGGIYGTSNNYSTFSKPSDAITDPTFPGTLMSYSETEFLIAEAAARGFTVPGSVEEHYEAAITASILEWGGTEEEAASYLSQAGVAYATAPGDFREKIGTQKWIALYNRGHEAWVEYRRLDAPELNPVEDPIGPFPLRFTYPVSEQNLNTRSYEDASSAIGGDVVTTPLFWDVTQ